MAETTATWSIPAEIASAIEEEAARRGVEPSAVARELLVAVVPGWIAASIHQQLDLNLNPRGLGHGAGTQEACRALRQASNHNQSLIAHGSVPPD
jgi:hypothetical protein